MEVLRTTVDYLDENGDIRVTTTTASLPAQTSGAFAGGDNGHAGTDALGNIQGATTGLYNFYERSAYEQNYIYRTSCLCTSN